MGLGFWKMYEPLRIMIPTCEGYFLAHKHSVTESSWKIVSDTTLWLDEVYVFILPTTSTSEERKILLLLTQLCASGLHDNNQEVKLLECGWFVTISTLVEFFLHP